MCSSSPTASRSRDGPRTVDPDERRRSDASYAAWQARYLVGWLSCGGLARSAGPGSAATAARWRITWGGITGRTTLTADEPAVVLPSLPRAPSRRRPPQSWSASRRSDPRNRRGRVASGLSRLWVHVGVAVVTGLRRMMMRAVVGVIAIEIARVIGWRPF